MVSILVTDFIDFDFIDIDTIDFTPTTDIKWKKMEHKNATTDYQFIRTYCLIQRWHCRFPEKSLKDIWLPIAIKED